MLLSLPLSLSLFACMPRDAVLQGTTEFTLAKEGNGPGLAGAASQPALLCWRGSNPQFAMDIGDHCALQGDLATNRDGTGLVVVAPSQQCMLDLDGEATNFTVLHGSFHFSSSPYRRASVVEGALGGVTGDGRHVSVRYAGTGRDSPPDDACDKLYASFTRAPAPTK